MVCLLQGFDSLPVSNTFDIYQLAKFVVLKELLLIFGTQSATKIFGIYQLAEFVVLKRASI